MKSILIAAAIAGTLAASAPAPLHAREPVSPEAMTSAVRYALPHLLSGVRTSCSESLAADGYLAVNGAALQAKFAEGTDALWPRAREAIMALGVPGKKGSDETFENLPDEALQPFVDGMLATVVAADIKPAQCADVERGLALIDPLPAENLAGLVGFILEMVERKDAKAGASARDR